MKKSVLSILAISLLLVSVWASVPSISSGSFDKIKKSNAFDQLQEGDIIFQTTYSHQSQAIQMATHSKYSHVGILFRKEGRWFVYEAIQPVVATPLVEFIRHGTGGQFVVKRLKDSEKLLTDAIKAKMREEALEHLGKDYDIYLAWDDTQMYCSELVWKIYQRALDVEIGEPLPLSNYDLSHDIVNAQLKARFGSTIPMDELMISPGAMFESEELETVLTW
jgi:hypothetical protein